MYKLGKRVNDHMAARGGLESLSASPVSRATRTGVSFMGVCRCRHNRRVHNSASMQVCAGGESLAISVAFNVWPMLRAPAI